VSSDSTTAARPRVAIIGLKGLPAAGGSARAGENMIGRLKERYDFRVYNTASHTERRSGVHDGVTQVVFPALPIRSLNTLFYYTASLLHCLFTGGIDLVHVFHIDAAFMIPVLRLRFPVIGGHRARPQEFSKWGPIARAYFDLMEWIFYRFPADALTAVSSVVVERYPPPTTRKIVYNPNGSVLGPDQQPGPATPVAQDTILFAAGRMMETKGAHVLLQSLSSLDYRGRVLLLGNPEHDRPYAARLAQMARGLDAEFLGLIKDRERLFALLRGAGVIVCPSFHEGMSNMLLEAASVARPLICSDIPENTAIFEPSEVVFFKTGDAADLAAKITWVREHPAEAMERARRGKAKVERDFEWGRLAQRYDELYRSVLDGGADS
jgi:glycosyltransferase involved in cell wall biosynthesis